MKEKRKVLWIGDASVATGFAKITHNVCDRLQEKGWDISILGLNYFGDPHKYSYPIYATSLGRTNGHYDFGLSRVAELVTKIRPDLVVILNDTWNIQEYLKHIGDVSTIATMPVDGKNCQGTKLNGLLGSIFWTNFGKEEACKSGFVGQSTVIPLGIDLEVFIPRDKKESLQQTKKPLWLKDSFIVGNINRNQPRKRLDLSIAYFAKWIRDYDIRDAYLYLHLAPTGDFGYDIQQLVKYYGISNRLIFVEPELINGIIEHDMSWTYGCFDIQLTTTQGEGWGFTQMEGMACGVPQIVPDWSALAEWTKDASIKIPCTSTISTANYINMIGGIADKDLFIQALNLLYKSKAFRDTYSEKGLKLVKDDSFTWDSVANKYHDFFINSLHSKGVLNGS